MRAIRFSTCCLIVAALAWCAAPARALQAGLTIDVHQDVVLPQGQLPNDFHVEGLICSTGTAPVLVTQLGDLFGTNFNYTITKVDPSNPGDCWYYFKATWFLPPPGEIPYCTVLHLGLLFDVNSQNVIVQLRGWWTRDGQPIGAIHTTLPNGGFIPLVGFDVPAVAPQYFRIGNGTLPGYPIPPAPPSPQPPLNFSVVQADVAVFPAGQGPALAALRIGGGQDAFNWIPVVNTAGAPISPVNPLFMAPDSFFDIFLETVAAPGLRTAQPAPVPAGGFLVLRQRVGFMNNNNQYEERWFWEIHGAQPAEACCFASGGCQDLAPAQCIQLGGTPKGVGTTCATTPCYTTPKGGCCIQSPTGGLYCLVLDQLTCEQQYGGHYGGDNSTCIDSNGNNVPDICESLQKGACCLHGQCLQVLAPECAAVGGTWFGVGSLCSQVPCFCRGDANCDGKIDFKDINPFVAALSGAAPCNFANCDVNGDGTIDFKDINPFVTILSSGRQCP